MANDDDGGVLPQGTPVLSTDDPEFGKRLCDALGLKPGDTVVVRTPVFDRTDGLQVPVPNDLDWSRLSDLDEETLRALGLQPWDDPDPNGETLWLFPGEFYDYLPDGMQIVTISLRRETFERGVTDNDTRYGALSYGIMCRGAKAKR